MKKKLKWGCLITIGLVLLLIASAKLYSIHRTKKIQEKNVLKSGAVDVADLKEADYQPFLVYLDQHAVSPVEYVSAKFKDHDIVILGEIHEQKETCELICNLVGPLYHQAGVRYFAMEILKYKNTALINQLVSGKSYDEQLALRLFRDCAWPIWGFKEYMDILKAIWEVNRKLPPGAERLKVVALDSDWDMYDLLCGPLWKKADDFFKMISRDKHMAKVVSREILDKGLKALVQIGYNHFFTHYRQPLVLKGKLMGETPQRFGYILHEKYGDRIFQICLHQRHFGPEFISGEAEGGSSPVLAGLLERIIEMGANTPVGFDVESSPFAPLRDRASYFFAFQNYVTFDDIARGYVFLKPLDEMSKVTWVEGFIDESNFEKARGIMLKKVKPRDRKEVEECSTPRELDEWMKAAMR